MAEPTLFGTLPTGEPVHAHTLRNSKGLSLTVINYGAIVTELLVPDRAGNFADIACGFDSLEPYLAGHPYFGCIAGRVAGRITGGRFAVDGKRYQLAINDPPNHLHGGRVGFDKKLWTIDSANSAAVHMSLISPDGDEGYPGEVRVRVSFRLNESNDLQIDYEATADAPTPLSLTHHGYFNLAGEGAGSIEDHLLTIGAATYAPADEKMGLLGRRDAVTAANDFSQPRRLGDAIEGLWRQHGDLYFLKSGKSRKGGILDEGARLSHPPSGRVMTVATTEDCLQVYTGASLDGSLVGKSGQRYEKFGAICLECEGYPDGANSPELGNIILRPGELYRQTTYYCFPTPKDRY